MLQNTIFVILYGFIAEDPDPLDPQDFGFLDPDPDLRGKISTKNYKEKKRKII